MNELQILGDRLKKIGIDVIFAGNYPWVYLDQVCGQRVVEKFMSEHGFTAGFLQKDGSFKFTDIKEIFKTIRKYSSNIPKNGINLK